MTAIAEFGPMVVETDIDRAIVGTLRLWLPTYLGQMERERGLTTRTFARPEQGSYANTLESDEFLDHQLPAVIVTTADMTDEPERTGDGLLSVVWRTSVSTIVRGSTPAETREIAALMGGSVRRALLHHGDLDGAAAGMRLTGGNIAPVPDSSGAGRYLAVAVSQFNVFVDDVLAQWGGPLHPDFPDPIYPPGDPAGDPDSPYGGLAAVSGVTVSITNPGS